MRDSGSIDGVTTVYDAELSVEDYFWEFAVTNRDAIEHHWKAALAANPRYFNGVVYMTSHAAIHGGIATARLFPTDFQTVLYWRKLGFPETGAIDGFGSALIRSADGAVVLGRQRPGQINSGMTYLPGGFIDARDVGVDGRVDLAASVLRELAEETGLNRDDGALEPGYIITRTAHQLSYAMTFRAHETAARLVDQIMSRLDDDPDSELQEVIAVRRVSDLEDSLLPRYAELLLRHLLAAA